MPLEQITIRKIKCDSSKCTEEIIFTLETIQQKPELLPDAFFRILTLQRSYLDPEEQAKGDQGTYHFCSKSCLLEWLKDYIPSKSPTQKAKEKEESRQANPAVSKQAFSVVPSPLIGTIEKRENI